MLDDSLLSLDPASNITSSRVEAPPGRILVHRLEMPLRRGKIIIPEGYNRSTIANEAQVISTGEGVTLFQVGERVFLSPSVSRFFKFQGGVELYICSESQVLCRVKSPEGDEAGAALPATEIFQDPGDQMREFYRESPTKRDKPAVTEGDSRGKR